jgi:hypothetical protein
MDTEVFDDARRFGRHVFAGGMSHET